MSSKYLKPTAIKGLNKVGNVFLPQFEEFPSFTQLGCAESVDRVLEDIPVSDRDGVAILFTAFRFLPDFCLRAFFSMLEWADNKPMPAGPILRQIRIGVRGIVFSLYYSGWKGKNYSGKSPLEIMDFKLTVIRD